MSANAEGTIRMALYRAADAVESGLLSVKDLIDSYHSSLLELHSAAALMLMGIWIALPMFDLFDGSNTFFILQYAYNNEMFWGCIVLMFGLAQLIAVRTKRLSWRRNMSFVNALLWGAFTALYMEYSPKLLGTVVCPTFIVSCGISYLRMSTQAKQHRQICEMVSRARANEQ